MPKNYHKNKSSYVWIWIAGIAGVLILLFVVIGSGGTDNQASGDYLTPAGSLQDAHGLAVDVTDPNKVWIASHTGLYMLRNDKELFAVGSGRDDYMGFSAHPTDPNTFFSSGHPATGGNIGFQKTTDGGRTWQKISDGVNGPVDFHALAVSQTDAQLIYGWYRGQLQKSTNGGQNWEIIDANFKEAQIISLVTDSKEKDTVYAATNAGLLVSRDQGKSWTALSEKVANDVITAAAVNPVNNQEILAYGQQLGLSKTTDGGQSWSKIDTPLAASSVLYISYSKKNPQVIYALNRLLEIYKTADGGGSWSKIR